MLQVIKNDGQGVDDILRSPEFFGGVEYSVFDGEDLIFNATTYSQFPTEVHWQSCGIRAKVHYLQELLNFQEAAATLLNTSNPNNFGELMVLRPSRDLQEWIGLDDQPISYSEFQNKVNELIRSSSDAYAFQGIEAKGAFGKVELYSVPSSQGKVWKQGSGLLRVTSNLENPLDLSDAVARLMTKTSKFQVDEREVRELLRDQIYGR